MFQKKVWLLPSAVLIIMLVSYVKSSALPPRSQISTGSSDPLQEETEASIVETDFKGVHYKITPEYEYAIEGLVVSANDNDVWYSRFRERDPLNTRDFCIIWGENLSSGNYLEAKFKTEEFYCSWFSKASLNSLQISNNHIIPINDEIYQKARQVKVGDQVRITGQLASYVADSEAGKITRQTSVNRTDVGNGACETIYAQNVEIIQHQNQFWRWTLLISKYSLIITLLIPFVI